MDCFIKNLTSEYRPCYVEGKKALFHRWEEFSKIVAPSPMIGGHAGGQITETFAIVEYEDGTIQEVQPNRIKFVTGIINEYDFTPHDERKKDDELLRLRQEYEALHKRFLHLISSKVIQQFDEYDQRKLDYKFDVSKFDEEFLKYKSAYELLKCCKSCNQCIKSGNCKYIKWGECVVYNCPHFQNR